MLYLFQMKIGVTGGIGSGKSFVVSLFKEKGALVFFADQVAIDLTSREEVKSDIIAVFGKQAYINDEYNRKYMASIVFSNPYLLQRLNDIIHPRVFEEFDKFCKENEGKVIVYESALMIETAHTHLFDKVILVTAPLEERTERVTKRDGVSRAQVEKRMKNQWTDDKKRQFADFEIENIEKSATKSIVDKLWKEIVD